MKEIIDNFLDSEYSFLGNFFECYVEMDGDVYPTIEHAFQASKTFDKTDRERIRDADTAFKAKKIGHAVELRSDWQDVKVTIMTSLVQKKFENSDLRKKLLATGDTELVSGGDTFWGIQDGIGENNLGKILMEIRSDILRLSIEEYLRACRDFLLSLGWSRDFEGDIMFYECWVPPWDQNCRFDLFAAVHEQAMNVAKMLNAETNASKSLTDVFVKSLNDDGTINANTIKAELKTSKLFVESDKSVNILNMSDDEFQDHLKTFSS